MSILITGVAGFIGSNFVKYFLNNTEKDVVGLDKLTYAGNFKNLADYLNNNESKFKFIKGDIANRELIEKIFDKHKISEVINFAAESHVDRSINDSEIFIRTNVLGTHNLLDIAMKAWKKDRDSFNGKRFVQISTDEVYGTLGSQGLFSESSPLKPRSPYSSSKAAADLIALAYYETYGIPIIIARPSNNYGPYQFPEKLIPLIINNALNHQDLPIYGDGKQVRDWLYVGDNCTAIKLVLEKGKKGRIYNIGSRNEQYNIDVVKKILEILKEKTSDTRISINLIKHVEDRLGHDRRYAVDPSLIQNELGWKPEVKFEEGLELTIKWYLNNTSWLNEVISGDYLNYYKMNYSEREDFNF